MVLMIFRSMENLNAPEVLPPPASPDTVNFTVHLQRGEMGFGFRIIGGQEEGTQVRVTRDWCCVTEATCYCVIREFGRLDHDCCGV